MASSVKLFTDSIVITGASLTAVTDGSTTPAAPSINPSLGVNVKAGKSVPAFTKSSPACVSTTLLPESA